MSEAQSRSEGSLLEEFVQTLCVGDVIATLRNGLIGRNAEIETPVGVIPLLYADYAASGRALRQVEDFILDRLMPFYANAHTEASHCGAFVNRVRSEARSRIASLCNASDDYAVIFAGAGATAGINRLVHLLGASNPANPSEGRPLVLVGPYEHHSNLLPWRESGAEIVEVPERDAGGPNSYFVETILKDVRPRRRVIGTFSAASNVTGVISDVGGLTALLKQYGALSVWDYAAAAPYVPIDMEVGGGIDAVVLSPHKFVGGPGASGLLLVRKDAVAASTPSLPGGGTVAFVSPWAHHYSDNLATREEAGTPNVIGDIRAALALMIKGRLTDANVGEHCAELCRRAAVWKANPYLELLGPQDASRIPIFSFRVQDRQGGYLHHQLMTRMLSDYFGVQARGGCACAGPYAHRLLGLERDASAALWERLQQGHELEKPGWTRVNFSCLMDDEEADRLIDAVDDLAYCAPELAANYDVDPRTARFTHKRLPEEKTMSGGTIFPFKTS